MTASHAWAVQLLKLWFSQEIKNTDFDNFQMELVVSTDECILILPPLHPQILT